jgi:hypothetical protein
MYLKPNRFFKRGLPFIEKRVVIPVSIKPAQLPDKRGCLCSAQLLGDNLHIPEHISVITYS